MKRLVALLMAICMMAVLFTGCESKGGNDEEVTLTWYIQKSVSNVSGQDKVMEEVNRYIKEKGLNVTLDLKVVDAGNYGQKISMMISSGEQFDICTINDATSYVKYARDGGFVELDDLLPKYGKAVLEKTDDYAQEAMKVDGKTYAIKNQGTYAIAQSFVFKKDLVEKYNFDYKSVTCLADLEPYLKTIKENEPNITPLFHEIPDKVDQNYAELTAGMVFNNEADEFQSMFDTEYYVNTWKIINDYYKKGYIAKDAISKTDKNSEKKSGKYAVMSNTGYYTEDGSKSSAQLGFPCVEAYTGTTPILNMTGVRTCISSTCKDPEKAMQLINLIWEDDYLSNTLAYGVEGINYTIDEERTAEIGSKSVVPTSGSEQTWALWHNFVGPLWDQWDSPWNTRTSLEMMQEVNLQAPRLKALGFVFDSDPVKTEYSKMSSIVGELKTALNIGCIDDVDSYIADGKKRLTDAGYDKVLEELNKQYKEWEKNNK